MSHFTLEEYEHYAIVRCVHGVRKYPYDEVGARQLGEK